MWLLIVLIRTNANRTRGRQTDHAASAAAAPSHLVIKHATTIGRASFPWGSTSPAGGRSTPLSSISDFRANQKGYMSYCQVERTDWPAAVAHYVHISLVSATELPDCYSAAAVAVEEEGESNPSSRLDAARTTISCVRHTATTRATGIAGATVTSAIWNRSTPSVY